MKETNARSAVVARSPKEGAEDDFIETVCVVVAEDDAPIELEQYVDASIESMSKAYGDFHAEERGALTIAGTDARRLIYTLEHDDMRIVQMTFYLAKGKRRYLITGTSRPEAFEAHRSRFEQIALSFRFE